MTHIEKFRQVCMKRGAASILGIGKAFRTIDTSKNGVLDYEEFKIGLQRRQMDFAETDMKDLFDEFDLDGNGTLRFGEFLEALRPPLSDTRKNVINKAFAVMDKSGDGTIGVDDLKGVYSVKHHRKYLNGEMTEKECLQEFLSVFEARSDDKDYKITLEEWMNYYSGVSASIDTDAGFSLMMMQNFKM